MRSNLTTKTTSVEVSVTHKLFLEKFMGSVATADTLMEPPNCGSISDDISIKLKHKFDTEHAGETTDIDAQLLLKTVLLPTIMPILPYCLEKADPITVAVKYVSLP